MREPWWRDGDEIRHRREARARRDYFAVDRTIVPPGTIDRMRAEAAGPSPDFQAVIDRVRRSGRRPLPVERELSEAQQRAHARLTEVIDSQVRRTIWEQAGRERFGDGRPGEVVSEVAGGLVGRVLRWLTRR